jgi:hypothetical protein
MQPGGALVQHSEAPQLSSNQMPVAAHEQGFIAQQTSAGRSSVPQFSILLVMLENRSALHELRCMRLTAMHLQT